ncbi:unnamed protein product, partial [Prorocentrum cordatum]
MARALGHQPAAGAAVGAAVRQLRVSDTGDRRFDGVIADGSMLGDRAVVKGEAGLHLIDQRAGEWVTAQRVKNRDLDSWLERERSGPGRDLRIMPVHRDSCGKTVMLLRESANLFSDPKFADWPFEGPPSARELLADTAAAGLELHLCPTWLAFDCLRAMQSCDQLNMQALASAELICLIIVRQRAVRRNPKAPDFRGLEQLAQSNFDESGGLKTTEFDKYMAEQQKTNATVLRSLRQGLEEQEKEKK